MSLSNYEPNYEDWARVDCIPCSGNGSIPIPGTELAKVCHACDGVGIGYLPTELFPAIGKPHPAGLE